MPLARSGNPTAESVRERVRRFAALRAAWRALEPGVSDRQHSGARAGTELLGRLQRLTDRAARAGREQLSAEALEREADSLREEVAEIDADLAGYARLLRAAMDGVPLERHRAALPSVASARRGDVIALRDADRIGVEPGQIFAGDQAPPRSQPAGSPGVPEPGSVLDSQPLAAVAAALRRRIAGDALGDGPAERVALRIDLSGLLPEERSALSQGLSQGDGTRGDRAAGVAILVNLVVRSVPDVEDELSELGLDLRVLKGEWLGEVDRTLKTTINALIADGAYDRACAISKLRVASCRAPVSPRVRDSSSLSGPSRAALDESAHLGALPAPSRAGSGSPRRARGVEARGRERPERRLPRSRAKWTLTAALLAAAVIRFAPGDGGDTRDLTLRQLASVSAHLESGYRNEGGSGPLFIGTLRDDWLGLKTEEQRREAERMVERLTSTGVREAMIFDHDNRLQVHHARAGGGVP